MSTTHPCPRIRERTGRLSAVVLLVVHALLGSVVAIADARPAAGHVPALAANLQSAPASAADPADLIDDRHECPFCNYLAAHVTPTPRPPTVAVAPVWVRAVSVSATVDPVTVDVRLRPSSRAPPVL